LQLETLWVLSPPKRTQCKQIHHLKSRIWKPRTFVKPYELKPVSWWIPWKTEAMFHVPHNILYFPSSENGAAESSLKCPKSQLRSSSSEEWENAYKSHFWGSFFIKLLPSTLIMYALVFLCRKETIVCSHSKMWVKLLAALWELSIALIERSGT